MVFPKNTRNLMLNGEYLAQNERKSNVIIIMYVRLSKQFINQKYFLFETQNCCHFLTLISKRRKHIFFNLVKYSFLIELILTFKLSFNVNPSDVINEKHLIETYQVRRNINDTEVLYRARLFVFL